MYCQFCGSEIPAGDLFCGQCGARAPVGVEPRATGESAYGARPGDPLPSFPGRAPAFPAATAYEYAGFWRRFGAYLLDQVFVLLIALIPGIILAVVFYQLVESGQDVAFTPAQQDQNDEELGWAIVGGFAFGWIPAWLIYTYVATALGGGWGKRICGMRIVRSNDGQAPGFGTAAIRVFVTILLGAINVVQLLDNLWMIWDKDKQTWHDKAAGTFVIRV
jgi:uncharacterized RDD family membrane protein YckC